MPWASGEAGLVAGEGAARTTNPNLLPAVRGGLSALPWRVLSYRPSSVGHPLPSCLCQDPLPRALLPVHYSHPSPGLWMDLPGAGLALFLKGAKQPHDRLEAAFPRVHLSTFPRLGFSVLRS